jgi:hypothetical protein
MMRHRRTQSGRDVVTPERRHRDSGEHTWHDRHQHTTAPGGFQGAAEDDNGQYGSEGEL